MTEQRRAERPRKEGDRKRGQRRQRRRRRIFLRKEQPRENQHRRGRVDVKVEKLDRGADEAGKQYLSGRVLARAAARRLVANVRADSGCVAQATYCRWFRASLQIAAEANCRWRLLLFSGGRTHGGGLLGLGVNADQRHSAHSAAADGNHVAASPQVGLHCFGQGDWARRGCPGWRGPDRRS